ncbi:MAG: hypothetical protein ACP5OZ_03415 [Candidatus Woesearchaeota archaeon]
MERAELERIVVENPEFTFAVYRELTPLQRPVRRQPYRKAPHELRQRKKTLQKS